MLKPSLFHRRRSRAPIFFALAAFFLLWQTYLLFFNDKNAQQVSVLWEPFVSSAMAADSPTLAVKSKSIQEANELADAKMVANAPLPDISVGVVDKSNKKNHVATSFEEHMVSFPNTLQQPTAKPAMPVTNTVKPTLPTMQEANEQLLKSDPTHYTIQLTSDHNIDDVKSFAEDYGLKDKATYFRTEDSEGNDLFVLIYGDFAMATDARAALDKMPEAAKAEGAFVAKISSIQGLLRD